ncbi:MAG: DUF4349 domain-containing protein [Sphingobacteriaceae bacterium]|nr:MAG: DUF4349 domain-containing protein [Sphingobacteriaceae bacterium]
MKAKILMMMLAGALLAACKGSGNYESMDSMADSVGTADINLAEPKLVKTAGINFKVKNVQQSSEKITLLTNQYKGMVMSHSVNTNINNTSDKRIGEDSVMRISAFYTSAQMTVKVPSVKLDEYLDSVAKLGVYVSTRSMDIEDKSLDYLSAKMKLNSRKDMVDQQKKGKIIIKDPSAVLNLRDDLVDEQIYNRKIDDAVKYSVVNLSFYQSNTIFKEVIANDDPASYNLPFFKRVGLALSDGWNLFKELLIVLINAWALILAGIVLWQAIMFYKRKRNTALKTI